MTVDVIMLTGRPIEVFIQEGGGGGYRNLLDMKAIYMGESSKFQKS